MENISPQNQKHKLEATLRVSKRTDLPVMHGLKENALKVRIAKIGMYQTANFGIVTRRRTNAWQEKTVNIVILTRTMQE